MRLTRRNALIGLGTVAAGAGVIGGTGAFSSVTAERNVTIATEGDASAALALEAADSKNADDYVTPPNGGEIVLNLDGTQGGSADSTGINQSAVTVIKNLIKVTNNGSQGISSLELDLQDNNGVVSESDANNIFRFTTQNSGGPHPNGGDVTDGNGIGVGNNMNFGVEIDLLNHSLSSIPSGTNFRLTITAST